MARNENRKGYATGDDAAYIKPRFIPDYQLMGRDDSGGPDYQPYTAQWGDGGLVQGSKKHLSASGGQDDDEELDEVSSNPREKAAFAAEPRARKVKNPDPGSTLSKSIRISKET